MHVFSALLRYIDEIITEIESFVTNVFCHTVLLNDFWVATLLWNDASEHTFDYFASQEAIKAARAMNWRRPWVAQTKK